MTATNYKVWTGEYWTFEQIVENLRRLVRSIVAKTTPEERIDDCMQDAWLRLYERLEDDPDALGPHPDSKSPHHTRRTAHNMDVVIAVPKDSSPVNRANQPGSITRFLSSIIERICPTASRALRLPSSMVLSPLVNSRERTSVTSGSIRMSGRS